MGDSEAPKAGGPPRFTFAALPKAPELPKPMVLPPPPSMPAPGSGPMSPTAVGSTAAGAGGGVSAYATCCALNMCDLLNDVFSM